MEEKNIKVEKVKIHKEGSTWILDEPFMDFSDTFEQYFPTFDMAVEHVDWLIKTWPKYYKRVWFMA